MKKKVIIITALVLAAALIINIAAAVYMFDTTIVREHASGERAQSFTGVDWNVYSSEREELRQLLENNAADEYYIKSDDGLNLYGRYYRAAAVNDDDGIKRAAICFHGYTGYGGGNSSAAAMYFLNNGFDVLLPDARAHGRSEGDYIGFGCLDRYDGLKWIEFIRDMYREEDSGGRLEIYLYGVSMGGATVCMMSGMELPPCVKGIVSDCAFTSPEEIFRNILKDKYHVFPEPILLAADVLCRAAAGYSLDGCSSAESVKNAKVPMLFIHGSKDSFIPVQMCYEIYDSCASEKDILIVDGAVHIESYYMARTAYENKLTEFLARCGALQN